MRFLEVHAKLIFKHVLDVICLMRILPDCGASLDHVLIADKIQPS